MQRHVDVGLVGRRDAGVGIEGPVAGVAALVRRVEGERRGALGEQAQLGHRAAEELHQLEGRLFLLASLGDSETLAHELAGRLGAAGLAAGNQADEHVTFAHLRNVRVLRLVPDVLVVDDHRRGLVEEELLGLHVIDAPRRSGRLSGHIGQQVLHILGCLHSLRRVEQDVAHLALAVEATAVQVEPDVPLGLEVEGCPTVGVAQLAATCQLLDQVHEVAVGGGELAYTRLFQSLLVPVEDVGVDVAGHPVVLTVQGPRRLDRLAQEVRVIDLEAELVHRSQELAVLLDPGAPDVNGIPGLAACFERRREERGHQAELFDGEVESGVVGLLELLSL